MPDKSTQPRWAGRYRCPVVIFTEHVVGQEDNMPDKSTQPRLAGRYRCPVVIFTEHVVGQEDNMPDKSTQPRLDVRKVSPDLYKATAGLQNYVDNSGLERKLLDLVKIRASQINGC